MTDVYVLIGLPGSGKTTWANNLVYKYSLNGYSCIHARRDAIRFALVAETDDYFSKEAEVRNKYHNMLVDAIANDVNAIIMDATNLTIKRRKAIIKVAKEASKKYKKDINLIAVNFVTPYEECLINNDKRKGRECVPHNVIKQMGRQLNYATCEEGFDEVEMVG